MTVGNGEVACDTKIYGGGEQIINSDGKASGTQILNGGSQFVNSDGKAEGTQVFTGGVQIVYDGGVGNNHLPLHPPRKTRRARHSVCSILRRAFFFAGKQAFGRSHSL
ncbi:MAG: hypothetical protein IIT59_02825, partial [Rhodocyclaceae bacterium]|nr:hypothetical protein [Rhodocyclaceae bacterium]